MTPERTPNNDEQPALLAFSDVTPSTTPEETPHISESGIESPKILQKTLNVNFYLFLENSIKMISEKFPSRTFAEKMEPALKTFKPVFSKIPPIYIILYLLIIFTWNHLQKSHLILLVLGCLLGYMLQNNSVASSRQKSVIYQEPYIQQNIESSLQAIKSAEKVTSTELSITPQVNEALNKTFDFIIRDLVNSFYDPINPNKNSEFSNQVRNAMNIMSMNLALCLQKIDQMEVGIMSSFAIANTFIIHLREYRKFIATNQSLEAYCEQNKSSPFVHTINRESQIQTLRCLSKLMLMRLLPSEEIQSHVLMAFLTELWTTHVLGTALETVCDPDWLNWTIVEYLTNKSTDETHDTTLFQQLATSIDEEVAGLSEKLSQPSADSKSPMLNNQLITSSPISYQLNSPLDSSFKEQKNLVVESLTEIPPDVTIQSAADDKELVLNDQSLTSSSKSSQTNFLLDSNPETFEEPESSIDAPIEILPDVTVEDFTESPNFSPSRPFMRSVNSEKLRFILERQNEAFAEFMAFLEEREAANLLRFWLQADSFRKIASDEPNINLMQEDALRIFNAHFGDAATYPVKIASEMIVNQCMREILKAPTCNCFVTLQEYVFGVLESEYFDDFVLAMRTRGEDMNFMYIEEPEQMEQSKNHLRSVSEISIRGNLFKRHTTGNLSPISNNSEYLDDSSSYDKQSNGLLTSETYRSRSYSAGSLVDALSNFTSSLRKRNSYTSIEDMTDSDSESPQIMPKMDLNGVRIKMTDVSESSPNKYIYSTKSLSYMIEVERPGSTGWIMTRFFSDFEKMHSALTKIFPKAEKVSMPRLMLKKSQVACNSLERYLNILLSDLTLCESEPLQKFMKRDGISNEGLAKSVSKNGSANSTISVPKSVSMVNILSPGTQDAINNKENSLEESLSLKRFPDSSLQEHLNVSQNIITEMIQEISEETSVKDTLTPMSSNVSPSVESTISTWESSNIVAPVSSNENDTSPTIINDNAESNKEPILEGLNIHYNVTASNSLESSKVPLIGPPPAPKKRTRPNMQMASHNVDLLIDTSFAIVEEIFDLSDKSQWHLRKTVLSVLRGVVRKSYTEAIKQSYLLTINSLFTEEYAISLIDNLNKSLWPDGVLADLIQQRSEEEKLQTKEEAKRLLLQKVIPDSLKQVMGYENSKIMIGRLVDGFLAEKEVLRGMGINILESVFKLIIND
ncbi:18310_t:CDS:2 [Dentiscutata erythropus]|uniref:18310_t:CDS:1 n=1 Tax=Dentiscutata erythropus TaxID=1348616 RepID=A0A9N9IFZ2_9GLOM|nr:18310_t:CDS:2 [Dentiscutata erythropus]